MMKVCLDFMGYLLVKLLCWFYEACEGFFACQQKPVFDVICQHGLVFIDLTTVSICIIHS